MICKLKKEKIKVYLYTRVSTTMQIDGYSLDAQKTKMKAFCDYNEYEIAGEYEDAGKSGKSIEGRVSFNHMMEDIKSGKDGVSYVLAFKLSRFGRSAADSTCNITSNAGFWCESDLCGGRNRFIQRCREAYDICSVSGGRDWA